MFPLDIVAEVLKLAGAWRTNEGTVVCGAHVCREWRDTLASHPTVRTALAYDICRAYAGDEAVEVWAYKNGTLKQLQCLLDYGKSNKLDSSNWVTVLKLAARDGMSNIVRLLLERIEMGRENNTKAFKIAAEYGYMDIMHMLSNHGADTTADRMWIKINYQTPPAVIQSLFVESLNFPRWDQHDFIMAAKCGRADIVQLLLNNGETPEAGYGLALVCAAAHGHIDVVRLLTEDHDTMDHDNMALRCAAAQGNADIVEIILGMEPEVSISTIKDAMRDAHNHRNVQRILYEHAQWLLS